MKTAFTHYFRNRKLTISAGYAITGGDGTSNTPSGLPVTTTPVDGVKPKSNPVSTGGTHVKQPDPNDIFHIDLNEGLLTILP